MNPLLSQKILVRVYTEDEIVETDERDVNTECAGRWWWKETEDVRTFFGKLIRFGSYRTTASAESRTSACPVRCKIQTASEHSFPTIYRSDGV